MRVAILLALVASALPSTRAGIASSNSRGCLLSLTECAAGDLNEATSAPASTSASVVLPQHARYPWHTDDLVTFCLALPVARDLSLSEHNVGVTMHRVPSTMWERAFARRRGAAWPKRVDAHVVGIVGRPLHHHPHHGEQRRRSTDVEDARDVRAVADINADVIQDSNAASFASTAASDAAEPDFDLDDAAVRHCLSFNTHYTSEADGRWYAVRMRWPADAQEYSAPGSTLSSRYRLEFTLTLADGRRRSFWADGSDPALTVTATDAPQAATGTSHVSHVPSARRGFIFQRKWTAGLDDNGQEMVAPLMPMWASLVHADATLDVVAVCGALDGSVGDDCANLASLEWTYALPSDARVLLYGASQLQPSDIGAASRQSRNNRRRRPPPQQLLPYSYLDASFVTYPVRGDNPLLQGYLAHIRQKRARLADWTLFLPAGVGSRPETWSKLVEMLEEMTDAGKTGSGTTSMRPIFKCIKESASADTVAMVLVPRAAILQRPAIYYSLLAKAVSGILEGHFEEDMDPCTLLMDAWKEHMVELDVASSIDGQTSASF